MASSKLISSILGIAVLIILLLTNPQEYQLKEYIKQNIKSDAMKEGGLNGSIKGLFAGTQSWFMTLETEEQTVIFFLSTKFPD
jgi:hypothetical protein